jgi:hypothetical protein
MSVAICGDPEVLVIENGVEYAIGLEPDAETVVVTAGEQGPPGPPGKNAPGSDGAPIISEDPNNRITQGTDGGLYVLDDLTPDPLAYYILAKG